MAIKVEFSKRTNLLEQSIYRYNLQDVAEPNLYREVFPYTEIPRVTFNHRHVPIFVPDEIWITDTTFRDGQQSRSPYTVEQILKIFDLLHKLDNNSGIIRQTEFFIYSEKDRKAVEKCLSRGYKYPEVTTWIRAKKEDFKLVKQIGIKETGILVSCSDYHLFKKLNLTRRQAIEKYLSIVESALENGIIPRCHFEDITRADFYSFVVPFANKLMNLSREAKMPIKIRACDTLGLGVSYPGAALPRCVQGIVYGLRHYSGSAVNTSLFGIGERTGNCPLEAMVIEYAQFRGTIKNMRLEVITEIANYFEKALNYKIPPRTPFMGRDFNRTRAGIHADGISKDEEIYNIFDTERILNRPVVVTVGPHSGLAGIAAWMNKYFKLEEKRKINKRDPRVLKLKEWIDKESIKGRVTSFSDVELESVIKRFMPELSEIKNLKKEE